MMNQMNNGRPTRARTLTPEQRRRILELRRRQKRKKQLMIAIPSALVVVLAVVLALTLPAGKEKDSSSAALDLSTADRVIANEADGMAPDDSADPEATVEVTPTPEPTADPNAYTPAGGVFVYDDAYVAAVLGANTGPLISADLSDVDPSKAARWPAAAEGYLPILYHSENTTENIIAVTVDDCFQGENLRKIVQCALDNNGKLTIFPIGDNIAKNNIGTVVKWAWESGMEIENHTYNPVGMYHFDDERMEKEMYLQNMQLNQVLGVNYTQHFFRPKGGDEREDQRVHAYAAQMGMKGIAMWTQSGSRDSMDSLLNNLAPGRIYLFHTTDNDLNKLLQFIPEATRRGYRLVTMNEMFGLPENETSALTAPTDPPALEPFKIIPTTLQKTAYIRAAAIVQKRLIELGWLDGEADGVYGQSSFMATGYFQLAADIKADGKSGPSTQAVLFADDAPAATSENKAKVQAKMKK